MREDSVGLLGSLADAALTDFLAVLARFFVAGLEEVFVALSGPSEAFCGSCGVLAASR
ncbi:MAG: hypothetical protein ACTIJJ_05220 [Galactobacter sp.]